MEFSSLKQNIYKKIQIAKKSWKNLTSYGLKNLANCHDIQFTHPEAGADAEVSEISEAFFIGF